MDAITKENVRTQFVLYAVEHGKTTFTGDYKKANKMHRLLQEIYKTAKRSGFLDVFEEFLNDEDENIKLWAAVFALRNAPVDAERALQELSSLTTITALTAKTTLHLWREGKLELL